MLPLALSFLPLPFEPQPLPSEKGAPYKGFNHFKLENEKVGSRLQTWLCTQSQKVREPKFQLTTLRSYE